MSFSFSFSAPIITEEEERAEWEALTEEERRQLRNEIEGIAAEDDDDLDTDVCLQTGKQMIQEALKQMPESEKREYMEALERAPDLVESESDSALFLRREQYDAWAAASRLVRYWKVRKDIFGADRAFLPMTLAGAIANDIETLEKGLINVHTKDARGRPIFFIDRARAVRGFVELESYRRCVYYMAHTVSRSEAAQKRGVIVIANWKGFDFVHYDRKHTKAMSAIIKSLPVKLNAFHAVVRSSHAVLMKVILPVMKYLHGKQWRQRLVLHSGSDQQVLRSLESHGIQSAAVSTVLRGEVGMESFLAWLEERRDFELNTATDSPLS